MSDGNPQQDERLVPRILYSNKDAILDIAIAEMLKYLGPNHAAVIAVQNLKQG